MKERDYIDSHREVSPLRKADDAIELDNSCMTIEEQKAWLLENTSKLHPNDDAAVNRCKPGAYRR